MPGPCSPYIDDGTMGEVLVVTSGSYPTGADLYTGRVVYNLTTASLEVYNGTAWQIMRPYQIVTVATRPTGAALFTGLMIFETDTLRTYQWNGSAWNLIASLAAYETFTNTVTQGATPTQASTYGSYHRSGRKITGGAIVTIGTPTTGTAANNVVVRIPVACAANLNVVVGEGYIFDASAGFFYYGLLRLQTTTTAFLLIRTAGAGATYLGSTSFVAALAIGDIVSWDFDYEALTAS